MEKEAADMYWFQSRGRRKYFFKLRVLSTLSALSAVFLLAGCPDDEKPTFGLTITIAGCEEAMLPGEERVLKATVEPRDAPRQTFRWESDAPDAVRVAANGVATALGPSERAARITATTPSGETGVCFITVREKEQPPPELLVDSCLESWGTLSLEEGEAKQLRANQSVQWMVGNEAVAMVNEEGILFALEEGATTLRAIRGDGEAAGCKVEVRRLGEEKQLRGGFNTTLRILGQGFSEEAVVTVGGIRAPQENVVFISPTEVEVKVPRNKNFTGHVRVSTHGKNVPVSSPRFVYELTAVVRTLAGNGTADFADGQGAAARFRAPRGIAVDPRNGNLYVADSANNLIRMITPSGMVNTVAGMHGRYNETDMCAPRGCFSIPGGLVIKGSDVYVADTHNHRLIKFAATGAYVGTEVHLFAGGGPAWVGIQAGFADAQGEAALFWHPMAIATNRSGDFFVADVDNHRIRRVSPSGGVTTLAGDGNAGLLDNIQSTRFHRPWGIAADDAGNVYVADTDNNAIRKISANGQAQTIAGAGPAHSGFADGQGTAARFNTPMGIAVDSRNGDLYVTDSHNHRIRKITPQGLVSTIAGSAAGFADDSPTATTPGTVARFHAPLGIAIDAAGNLYVADLGNHSIRKITFE